MTLLSCIAAALTAVGVFAAEPVFPRLEKTPVIDGVLEDGEWRGAAVETLLTPGVSPQRVQRTEVRYGRDDTTLYAAFKCYDRDIAGVRRMFQTPEERDNDIWRDDTVELRFDPWNGPDHFEKLRQIIVNANGIVYDAVGTRKSVNFNVQVHTRIAADSWTVELAVPLTELCGYTPGDAELWRIGLFRADPRTDIHSALAFERPVQVRDFRAPEHYKTFRSAPIAAGRPFTVTGLHDGKVALRRESAGAALPFELTLRRADGKTIGAPVRGELRADQTATAMNIPAAPNAGSYRLTGPGNYVLEWSAASGPVAGSKQVATTKNPLYRELWSDVGPGVAKTGALCWTAGFNEFVFATALEFAFPWSRTMTQKLYADHRLLPMAGAGLLAACDYDWYRSAPDNLRYVLLCSMYLWNYSLTGIPLVDGRPTLLEPSAQKLYLDYVENAAKPFRDKIAAFSVGDEVSEYESRRLLRMFADPVKYPTVAAVPELIRNKYGAGQYGPPESAADPNPYRWIAFRHYVNDEMFRLHREVNTIVKREYPGAFVVSDDPMADQNRIYDFAGFTKELCDVMTHQLYPRNNPAIADFSFTAKYLADLTAVDEIWPCPHVENYGGDYTPTDVIEKLSQAARAGATGWHWYLADTRGGRGGRGLGSEYFGAPERWQIEMALTKEIGAMNRLKFPDPDCGVFVSTASVRALPGFTERPYRTQMLHSLLEISSRVWFRYASETSLKNNPDIFRNFKAVFVPDARYIEPAALTVLENYVRDGGTLVVTDPTAFQFSPVGQSLAARRTALTGVADTTAVKTARALKWQDAVLPLGRMTRFMLAPTAGAEIAARYDTGEPAMLRHRFGKGTVLTFGCEFTNHDTVSEPAWSAAFAKFTRTLALAHDRDIWRFRFPDSLMVPPTPVKGRCITGNFIYFQGFKPYTGANLKLKKAVYRYRGAAPDCPAEKVHSEAYTLENGKLTDRRTAWARATPDNRVTAAADHAVGWTGGKAFAVEFDFGKTVRPARVELFYQGTLRDLVVKSSVDGQNFVTGAVVKAAPTDIASMALVKRTIELETVRDARYIVLEFAANPAPQAILPADGLEKQPWVQYRKFYEPLGMDKADFQIAEIEVWEP